MSPPSRSRSPSSYSSSSSNRSRFNNNNNHNASSAFFHRVPAAVLLIALLFAAPAFSAAAAEDAHDDHDDEPPIEHLFEVYDNDASGGMNATELAGLFASLQEGATPPEAAGAHDDHAHAAEASAAAVAVTEILSIAHILEDYAGNSPAGLNASAFLAACPAMLKCAAEQSCEFEHQEAAAEKNADGGSHVGLKITVMFIIFIEGLAGGLLPLLIRRLLVNADGAMSLLNAFSGGVFLAAGLVHILPHVIESAAQVDHGEYPLPYALVLMGYVLIFLVERVLFHQHAHSLESEGDHHAHGHTIHRGMPAAHSKPGALVTGASSSEPAHAHAHAHASDASSSWAPFNSALVLLVAISLHAVLAGVSLGVQSKSSGVIAITVAICAHKAPAAFAVGSKFVRSGMPRPLVAVFVLAFAAVTPLGIGVGIGVGSRTNPMVALVLEGLAAGTFIYIGATEIAVDEYETTAEECDETHGYIKVAKAVKDVEVAAVGAAAHTHRVHGPPDRWARLKLFAAYLVGCLVILLAALAPHAD